MLIPSGNLFEAKKTDLRYIFLLIKLPEHFKCLTQVWCIPFMTTCHWLVWRDSSEPFTACKTAVAFLRQRCWLLLVYRQEIFYSFCTIKLAEWSSLCGSLLTHTHTHTHTQPFNGLWSGTTRVGRYQKKHSPTHTHPDIGHPLSYSSIYNDPWHPLCSVYELDSPLGQPLSRSSLVFLLALDPQLHTRCISSPNHHHLFAAHAHTNAACFAAIPVLCHLYLVSLSQLLTWESIF